MWARVPSPVLSGDVTKLIRNAPPDGSVKLRARRMLKRHIRI